MARRRKSVLSLRELIETRAQERCEYCHAPQAVCGYRFHLEHIIPSINGGSDDPSNRALACAPCNLAKIDKQIGADPETDEELPLFHPRRDNWDEHFRWGDDRQRLVGLTATGRATIATLDMNNPMRLSARQLWFTTGWLP